MLNSLSEIFLYLSTFIYISKIDKIIQELCDEAWFRELLDDFRYSHLFGNNRNIRAFLLRPDSVEQLKNNPSLREEFIKLVESEHKNELK